MILSLNCAYQIFLLLFLVWILSFPECIFAQEVYNILVFVCLINFIIV